MKVYEQTLREMKELYFSRLSDDFPPAELKPFSSVERMYNDGCYIALALKDNEELVAYAWFTAPKDTEAVLLDYFAVKKELRGKGIGSKSLKAMKEYFCFKDAIILETEHIDFYRDEKDRETRIRRKSFYEKNGLVSPGIHTSLFGVDYHIMQLPCRKALSKSQTQEAVCAIYKYMFPPSLYGKKVFFGTEEGYAED